MFYVKNVPGWERAMRVVAGLAMIAGGLLGFKGELIGYILAAAGVVGIMTGFMGFCPMCALAGRRIEAKLREKP
jgi:Protein of unknown function (DUF2892)